MAAWCYHVMALVELGKADEAEAAVKDCEEKFPKAFVRQWSRAYLKATPSMGAAFDPQGALALLDEVEAKTGPMPNSTVFRARAFFLAGRYEDCVSSIQARLKAKNFEAQYWGFASSTSTWSWDKEAPCWRR